MMGWIILKSKEELTEELNNCKLNGNFKIEEGHLSFDNYKDDLAYMNSDKKDLTVGEVGPMPKYEDFKPLVHFPKKDFSK